MTREEKIRGLYSLEEYLVEHPIELNGHKSLPITLIDYAIEALEQELCPQAKTGYCKDCKYFHSYHEIERVPHITAHNVCYRWGNKCFTKEDGYCYLFEPKEESEGTHKVRWINGEMTTTDPQIRKDFREKLDKLDEKKDFR